MAQIEQYMSLLPQKIRTRVTAPRWHLDEVFVSIARVTLLLEQAVRINQSDQEGSMNPNFDDPKYPPNPKYLIN